MRWAELEALGAEIERTGESIFKELAAQSESETLTIKLNRWRKAVAEKPLSDEALLEREVWRAEWHARDQQRRQRDEQARIAHERAQHEKARREAAAIAEQEQNRLRRERHEQYEREARQRELRDQKARVAKQDWFQKQVQVAAHAAAIQQKRQATAQALNPVIAALEGN